MHFLKASGTAFFAGGLSLVSQIIGLRIVAREVSASELTVALVLVSALGGLSLGALVSGRLADRQKSRSRSALGFANFLLASAGIVVLLLALFGQTVASRVGMLELPELLEVFGFLLLSIVPINVLLGGVVPVLTKTAMGQAAGDVQSAFGWVYALETLGAALGSWMVVFVTVPAIGGFSSLIVAAVIVLVWVTMATLLRKRKPLESIPPPTETNLETRATAAGEDQRGRAVEFQSQLRWLILLAAFASSCASLGMELVWQRYFAVILGSDSHSYAVVATMFLIGNAIGAALASRILRFKSASHRLYQWQLLLVAGAILVSVWALGEWFRLETMQWALGWLERNPLFGRLAMAVTVLLLPATLIGSALPVLVTLWSAGRSSVSTHAGQVYALVIIGNIVGVLVCAFWLIPSFGLRVSAVVLSAVCLMASLGMGCVARARADQQKTVGRAVLSLTYGMVLLGAVGLAIQVVNSSLRPGIADDGRWVVDHYVEQASHTVAVTHASESPTNKRLMIDGVTIGESGGGVDEKQQVLAHLPFVIGDARRGNVLTIGLGTGILAGELASNEQVDSVTCVELSAAVIEASNWFTEENRNVLQNGKLKLVHGDGVRYLRNAETAFDVIVSDGKSRPGAASNLPFFSAEYYRICADALSDQGVFVQWVSLRCDRNEFETILATFCHQFPYGHVAIAAPDSVYLVGARSPISFNDSVIEEYLQDGATERLKSYAWAAADDFLSMYWLDQSVVADALSDVAVNTFDQPVLENFAWASYGHSLSLQPTQLAVLQELIDTDTLSLFNGKGVDESQSPEAVARFKAGRRAAIELMAGEATLVAREEDWLDRSSAHFKRAVQELPKLNRQIHVVQEFRRLASEANQAADVNAEYSAIINISELAAANASEEFRMATILDQAARPDLAIEHFYNAAKLSEQHPRYVIALGEAMLRLRKYAGALRRFEQAIDRCEDLDPLEGANTNLLPTAKLLKGIALQKLGRPEAVEIIQQVLQTNPELLGVYQQYGF